MKRATLPALLILGLSIIAASCTKPEHPYQAAVGLIKSKKYDAAREMLQKTPKDDSLSTRSATALIICEVGNCYLRGEFREALDLIDSTAEKGGQQYFVLNVPPSDPLYSHIATLALLASGEVYTSRLNDFITLAVDDTTLEDWGMDNWYDYYYWDYIMKTPENAVYKDVEYAEGSQWGDVPFLRMVRFDKLTPPAEWKSEAGEMIKRMNELKPKIDEKTRQFNEYAQKAGRR
jgi:hypothetical protein